MALLLVMTAASVLVFANTTRIPTQGTTTIIPNSLMISWEDGSREPITVDTFRFFGYNVAQLRTMVSALDGSISTNADGTFQITTTTGGALSFSPVSFRTETEIDYIINQTRIRNFEGRLTSPSQPGWVLLTDYGYNWASVRDVIDSLNLTLVDVSDNPDTGVTEVTVARPLPLDQQEPPSQRPPAGPPARPPDTRGGLWSNPLQPLPTTSPGGLLVTPMPSPTPWVPMPLPSPGVGTPMPSPGLGTPMPTPPMSGYGSISGLVLSSTNYSSTVSNEWRRDGLQAGVTLHSSINSPPLDNFRTTSSALGVYSIGDIPVGQYYVRIEAEDYVPEFIHITVLPGNTTYIPTLRAVRLDENRASEIHGYIFHGQITTDSRSVTRSSAPRVTDPITIEFREGLTKHGRIVETVTVRNGEFRLSLPVGNYYVTARGNGYHETQRSMFNWPWDNSIVSQSISISPVNMPSEAFRIELSFDNPDVLTLASHLRGPNRSSDRAHLQTHRNEFVMNDGRAMAYLNDAGRVLGADGGTIRINEFIDGRYDYYVHYSFQNSRGHEMLRTSSAVVRVFDESNNLLRTFHVPSTGIGDRSVLWHVFSIEVRNGQRTIVPVNTMHDGPTSPHDVGR